MRRNPVPASRLTSSARTAGSRTWASFWSPSRGPTSQMVTLTASFSLTMEPTAFVIANIPPPPARVLEIGCGAGELARALAAARYDVTALDPDAPEGPIFERVRFEELPERGRFDAVVANRSLHHIADLGAAVDKIARLLEPGGGLVLDEFGWDRLDEATAVWLHERGMPGEVERWRED